ncbi:MAG TPA: RNA 2',3'-cyclic phosphodiesterase [Gaiellaceae bacterium]
MGGSERLRLFLALRLPDDVLDEIEGWQAAQLPRDVRAVARENLHVTLAFLGSRPADEVDAIAGALRDAAADAGDIRLRPVRYRETRKVGMLVLDDARHNAEALAGDVQERLERLGVYRREARPWLPHLTVARWRERPYLLPEPPPDRTFVPSDAAAYVSRLHAAGARYAVLKSFDLA